MSTERVDVLAVMGDCESLLAAAKIRADLAAARAAIAELIEAGRGVLDVHERQFGSDCGCRHGGLDRMCRLRAALARIGAP